MNRSTLTTYIEQHRGRWLKALKSWLAIPSISPISAHLGDVQRAGAWLAEHMRAIGLENIRVIEPQGRPLIYADWLHAGPERPTALIYGHYDVVAATPLDAWTTPPFEPTVRRTERGEDLFARGASDDKGQVFAHLLSIEAMLACDGRLPVNVKLLIEGEEESGSPVISAFAQSHAAQLQADVCVVSDTSMAAPNRPTIDYGLRGIWCGELTVRGPSADLHSGSFGGAVHNPLQALCELVASLHDPQGRIAVPGFYDGVRELPEQERQALRDGPLNDDDIRAAAGVIELYGEPGLCAAERIGARPTLEVNGLVGGDTSGQFKAIIPASASAKLSARLVAHQDPARIPEFLCRHLEAVAPRTVTWSLSTLAALPSVLMPPDSRAMALASRSYEAVLGTRPSLSLCGGSIPVVSLFRNDLGLDVVLMGFGLPDDGIHGPDERISLDVFERAVLISGDFLARLGQELD